MRSVTFLSVFGLFLVPPVEALAANYHVGPGQAMATIGEVPWHSLSGGDTVYIYWKETPYHEKFLISTRASSWPGLRVIGVPNAAGELPIIDGENATTGSTMHWRSAWAATGAYDIEGGGVISVAPGADSETNPAYIHIENLVVRNAREGTTYTAEPPDAQSDGATGTYGGAAAAIYAKNPQHLRIINCEIANSENGFFNTTNATQGSADWWDGLAEDIIISGCYFHGNGSPDGEVHHHSIYVQADRVVVEKSYFGPMLPGTGGNQLKSRSAGDVIRYNYMEGEMGGRFIDLVEEQDSGGTLAAKSYYAHDFIYGNIFLRNQQDADSGLAELHWDGDHYDGGRATVAGARLYVYDNTWIVNDTYSAWDRQAIFSIKDAGDSCPSGTLTSRVDARNNIFYSMGVNPKRLWWAACPNTNVHLENNWVSTPMAGDCSWDTCTGTVEGNDTNVTASAPGLVDVANGDVHLVADSSALGAGAALAPEVTTNDLDLDLTPTEQYASPRHTQARSIAGDGADLGALQLTGVVAPSAPTNLTIIGQ